MIAVFTSKGSLFKVAALLTLQHTATDVPYEALPREGYFLPDTLRESLRQESQDVESLLGGLVEKNGRSPLSCLLFQNGAAIATDKNALVRVPAIDRPEGLYATIHSDASKGEWVAQAGKYVRYERIIAAWRQSKRTALVCPILDDTLAQIQHAYRIRARIRRDAVLVDQPEKELLVSIESSDNRGRGRCAMVPARHLFESVRALIGTGCAALKFHLGRDEISPLVITSGTQPKGFALIMPTVLHEPEFHLRINVPSI